MYQTILLPSDGSALSKAAATAAIELARKLGASLVAMSVAEPYPYSPYVEFGAVMDVQAFADAMQAAAHACVQEIGAEAAKAGVPCTTHVATSLSPSDEIVRTAQDYNCDLIFMATHGHGGLQRLLLGSQTQRVLAHAAVPVLVYR